MFFGRNREYRRTSKENIIKQRLKNMPKWRYRRFFKDASGNYIQHPKWIHFIGTRLEYESAGRCHHHDEPKWYWQKIRQRRQRRDYKFELAASEYEFRQE